MISITRFLFDPPRQTLRAITTFSSAAETRGIKRIPECVFVASANGLSTVLLKKKAFSHKQLKTLHRVCMEKGFTIIYSPLDKEKSEANISSFLKTENKETFLNSYPFDVTPSTDNRPYFFFINKLTTPFKYISSDEGQTWNPAKFIGLNVPYAWRHWEYLWNAEGKGNVTIMTRATSMSGNQQPETAEWNVLGYSNNGIEEHAITIQVV